MMYTLPYQYGNEVFMMDFLDQRWFMPASAHPYINVSVIAGVKYIVVVLVLRNSNFYC